MTTPTWYLLRVRPTYEDIAAEFLGKRVMGAEVYYPKAKRQRVIGAPRVAREVTTEVGPAIVGYVFARFTNVWPDLNEIDRYCSASPQFIMRAEQPLTVRQSVIDDVRVQEAKGAYDRMLLCPLDGLAKGMTVRIPSGPFYGYTGKIRHITEEITKVSVKLLGKPAFISLSTADVLDNLC